MEFCTLLISLRAETYQSSAISFISAFSLYKKSKVCPQKNDDFIRMAFLERDEEKIGNGFLKNDLSILVSSSDRCTINKSSINYVIKNDNDEMKHYRRKLQLQSKYAKHYTSCKSTFFPLTVLQQIYFLIFVSLFYHFIRTY